MMHQLREIFVIILAITIGVSEAAQAQCQANELAKLTASDGGAGDEFGRAVSISGNVAVIGAYHDDDVGEDAGSAYVYRFDGTSWIEEAQLTASDAEPGDLFGYSTFVNGNVILIGAYQDDNVAIDAGSVYVFRYDTDQSKWLEEAKLTRPDADFNDEFGWTMYLSGDLAMIGAVHDDDSATNAGAVYVYRFDPETVRWIDQAKLTASDAGLGDHFGWSISLSGDVAVIGSPLHDGVGMNAGSAYVFIEPPGGWVDMTETARLTASDAATNDRFGLAASISGDVAMIGANGDDDFGSSSGSVYVFEKPKGGWVDATETVKLNASDAQPHDTFGWSVSLSGDVAVIGARLDDNDVGGADSGSAYVFRLDPDLSQWIEQAKLTASDAAAGDRLGWAVSLNNETAVIGALWDDDGGTNAGSAYIFGGLGDCNDNGELDLCDIADGKSTDDNNNGIPDECENDCPWDLDGNDVVGAADLLLLLAGWGTDPGGPPDFDGDGNVGAEDLRILLRNWGPCP